MKGKFTLAAARFARTAILGLVTGAVAALFVGCATSPKESEFQRLVWPPPSVVSKNPETSNY